MQQNHSRTEASRSKNRMHYDLDLIYAILDEAFVCTASYVKNGEPHALPTGYVRSGEWLYIHGSVKGHFFRQLEKAGVVCITAFMLDGMVLAKSGLHHTFNYRSVVLFGAPEVVTDRKKKENILADFTNRYVPGRWDDIRKPSPQELDATAVIGFRIEEASVKIRQGPPNDSEKDKQLPVWSGVVPVEMRMLEPVPDENNTVKNLPPYLSNLAEP